jgi:hypothetical protein
MPDKLSTEPHRCVVEVEEAIKKMIMLKNAHKPGFTITESGFADKSFYPVTQLYANYEYQFTFTKADGTSSRIKNGSTSILFNFCPFCGKSLKQKSLNENTQQLSGS